MKCARCNRDSRKHTGTNRRCPNKALGFTLVPALLTPRAARLLKALADGYGFNPGEQATDLVYERGAGWWSGTGEVSGQLTRQLIRLCLISMEPDSREGEFERWCVNEEGRALLADPMYRPKILSHPSLQEML